jgi:hypothetical protein
MHMTITMMMIMITYKSLMCLIEYFVILVTVERVELIHQVCQRERWLPLYCSITFKEVMLAAKNIPCCDIQCYLRRMFRAVMSSLLLLNDRSNRDPSAVPAIALKPSDENTTVFAVSLQLLSMSENEYEAKCSSAVL